MPKYSCALITGASSGLGMGFAEELSRSGSDIILVARSVDKLEELAARLRGETGCRVEAIPLDLSREDSPMALFTAVSKLDMKVDLLINNAGLGQVGSFLDQPIEALQQIVSLNCPLIVSLSYIFLPGMVERKHGAIVNIGSLGSFQPMPGMAVYGASKAFLLSFSQALAEEYGDKGIQCLAYCLGPIDTGFFKASGRPELRNQIPSKLLLSPSEGAKRGLRALAKGKRVYVSSYPVALFCQLYRILPKRWVTHIAGHITNR